MPWIKVPPQNHPVFLAALPSDPRVETMKMFGGIAAKVNGNIFAGLFGLSTMVWLPESERAAALALKGAAWFDPMGNGRVRSDKIMLPAGMMTNPTELRRWILRAFKGASALPAKGSKPAKAHKAGTNAARDAPASPKKRDAAKPKARRAAKKRTA